MELSRFWVVVGWGVCKSSKVPYLPWTGTGTGTGTGRADVAGGGFIFPDSAVMALWRRVVPSLGAWVSWHAGYWECDEW